MNRLEILKDHKTDLECINWWPEGDSVKEILKMTVDAVIDLLCIEIEKEETL